MSKKMLLSLTIWCLLTFSTFCLCNVLVSGGFFSYLAFFLCGQQIIYSFVASQISNLNMQLSMVEEVLFNLTVQY